MRQETVTYTLYKFDELNDKAKERARDWWRDNLDYHWHDDYRAIIEAFCNSFNVKLKNYEVSAFGQYWFKTDNTNENFRGLKLKDINRDNMPTGFCADNDLWFAFYDEFKRTGDAKAAFDAALHAGFKSWREDIEYQYSDEATDENIIANDYDFLESGKIY